MFCPKCGRPVPSNSQFCGNCGQAIDSGGNDKAGGNPDPGGPGSGPGATASVEPGPAWEKAASPLPSLVQRVKNILLTPKTEWPVIAAEPTTAGQLYTGYVMPLAALAALISFVHMSVIGISMPFGDTLRTPFLSGLALAIVSFGFGLLGLFLVGLIINGLAPTFSGERNQRQALKTAAYAFTPAWLGSVLGLLPAFATLLELAAGIYGIYLLYLGLPQLMRSPREKAVGYTAAVVVCTIVLGIVFGTLSAVTGGFGNHGRFGGLSGATMTPEERQQRAAAAVGGMLGGALGTDEKGKAGLTEAIGNLAAAGQKMEQQQNGSPAATAPAPSTTDPQNPVAATTGLLTALGGAMGGSHRVDPVDFHTLKELLPQTLSDMQRTDAQGSSQQALGVKGSSATANYQGAAGARAQIKISDLSGVSGLLGMADSMTQGTSSESDTGYEKNATLGGRTVHEKYDNRSRHGEISAIVAKRFGVDVTGDGVDMAKLEEYASSVDFGRLESMKDVGAQPHSP
jgi:Yip1 domain/zinc-ribbon domain